MHIGESSAVLGIGRHERHHGGKEQELARRHVQQRAGDRTANGDARVRRAEAGARGSQQRDGAPDLRRPGRPRAGGPDPPALADELADATLLVNPAGFFIPKALLDYDGASYDFYLELQRAAKT
jgi:hypothetical protein